MWFTVKNLSLLVLTTCLCTTLYADKTGNQPSIKPTANTQLKIYYGGDIVTMDRDKPQYVEAVVPRGGKIEYVGSRSEAFKRYSQHANVSNLKGKTIGPTYQLFEENRKGRIKPGLLADFVILDKNPLKTDVMKIKTIQVLETIKEGRTIYSRQTLGS